MITIGSYPARPWAWVASLALAGLVLLHGVAWLTGIHLVTREVDAALVRTAADAGLRINTSAIRWRGYPTRLEAGLKDVAIIPAGSGPGAMWTLSSPDIIVSWTPTAGRVLRVTGPILATFGGAGGGRVTATVHITVDDNAVATGGDRLVSIAVSDLTVLADGPVLQVSALDAALSLRPAPPALTISTITIKDLFARIPMLGTMNTDRLTADMVATPPLPLGLSAAAASRWRSQNGSLVFNLATEIGGYDMALRLQGGLDPQLNPHGSGILTVIKQVSASPSLAMLPLLFAIGMRQDADGTLHAPISLADGRLSLGSLPPIRVEVIDWR